MLIQILIVLLLLGFVWNRNTIEELRLQVFDLNQEILQTRLELSKFKGD